MQKLKDTFPWKELLLCSRNFACLESAFFLNVTTDRGKRKGPAIVGLLVDMPLIRSLLVSILLLILLFIVLDVVFPVTVFTIHQQKYYQPHPLGTYFSTLPPGSPLPSDAECAARVRRGSWEPRPDNAKYNQTAITGYTMPPPPDGDPAEYYHARVTGNFTGTTDEIIQWGACKWGIDEDIVRAQAVVESDWHQSVLSDSASQTQPETDGNASVGILQVKGADIPPTFPGIWPYAYNSTAFNVDFALSVRRACFDGKITWLGNGYQAGDIWGCVGEWYSGSWYTDNADYIASVKQNYNQKPWLNW